MAKQAKNQRKYGRNATYCKYYASTFRRERNKLERLKKHLKRFPDDAEAAEKVKYLQALVFGR